MEATAGPRRMGKLRLQELKSRAQHHRSGTEGGTGVSPELLTTKQSCFRALALLLGKMGTPAATPGRWVWGEGTAGKARGLASLHTGQTPPGLLVLMLVSLQPGPCPSTPDGSLVFQPTWWGVEGPRRTEDLPNSTPGLAEGSAFSFMPQLKM